MERKATYLDFYEADTTNNLMRTVAMTIGESNIGTISLPVEALQFSYDFARTEKQVEKPKCHLPDTL